MAGAYQTLGSGERHRDSKHQGHHLQHQESRCQFWCYHYRSGIPGLSGRHGTLPLSDHRHRRHGRDSVQHGKGSVQGGPGVGLFYPGEWHCRWCDSQYDRHRALHHHAAVPLSCCLTDSSDNSLKQSLKTERYEHAEFYYYRCRTTGGN